MELDKLIDEIKMLKEQSCYLEYVINKLNTEITNKKTVSSKTIYEIINDYFDMHPKWHNIGE